jgi:hypothetical protein
MSTLIPYRVRCGGCGKRLSPGQMSGSTAQKKPLCEECALALDRVRAILRRLGLRLTRRGNTDE